MFNLKLSSKDKSDDNNVVRENIQTVVLYALSFCIALGFNNVVTSIFNSFYETQHIISKTTYVVILFGLSLLAAYWFSQQNTSV